MRRNILIVVGSVAALSTAALGQGADLNGDQVSLELWSSTSGSFGVNTVTVGPGDDTNFFNNQFIDFNAGVDGDTFTVSSTSNFSSIDGVGGQIQWILTDLDFPGGDLVGVNIVQGFSDVQVVSMTADSVTFEYEDIAIPQGTYFQAQFVVPAPASAGLMGVAGLAALRRRRR